MKSRFPIALLVILLLPSACSTATSIIACSGQFCLTPTVSQTLHLYQTSTDTPTPTPPLFKSPTPTATATATPTPVTYIVKTSDDMYGIAFSFGISPKALMTANPSVNPRYMSVGSVLIIPVTPGTPAATSTPKADFTPTAAAVSAQLPQCYWESDGEVWCFMLASNLQGKNLESVIGAVHLTVAGQNKPLTQDATTLLDILPAGQTAPLVAYFSGVSSSNFSATGEITFSASEPDPDSRYLQVNIDSQQVSIAGDAKSASVTGQLALKSTNTNASKVDLALTAYSSNGTIVGVRKWESNQKLASGSSLSFEVSVYSLGPDIAKVTLQAEAQS